LSVASLGIGNGLGAYELFVFAINSDQTREKYITRLKKFLEIIEIDPERKLTFQEKCSLCVDKAKSQDGWLLGVLLRFFQCQKDRVSRKEITGSTLQNYVKVLKLFCEMNDLFVPWKKLTRGLPKGKNYADDRVPRLDELQKIIAYPDWRMKAIVCTMVSSGIRLGAWDSLLWEHITPIYREDTLISAKIIVYAGRKFWKHAFILVFLFKSV
jgi:hypothetical protein